MNLHNFVHSSENKLSKHSLASCQLLSAANSLIDMNNRHVDMSHFTQKSKQLATCDGNGETIYCGKVTHTLPHDRRRSYSSCPTKTISILWHYLASVSFIQQQVVHNQMELPLQFSTFPLHAGFWSISNLHHLERKIWSRLVFICLLGTS